MKIFFIRPAIKKRKLIQEENIAWKMSRVIYNNISSYKIGLGNEIPSLAIMILAALTPRNHEVRIIDEDVEKIDFKEKVDLVGISILTLNAQRGYEIADLFRKKGVKVVIGGMHATVLPGEAATHADAVVIGEAEEIWESLLNDVANNRLKKYYKSKSLCDMSTIPEPRRELLSEHNYLTTSVIQTTRGCPNFCSFCSIHAVAGNKYRYRPIKKVISELEKTSFPYTVVVDDNIAGNLEYMKRLFKDMIPLKLRWFGQSTIDIARDDELLKLASRSGCKLLLIGFESLNQENIKRIGKLRTNKVVDYGSAIKKIHNHGISIAGTFILGLDNDDKSVFDRTIEFIEKNNIEAPTAGVLTPYPGTRLFKKLDSENRIITKNWDLYSPTIGKVIFKPKNMTPEELEEGRKYVADKIYASSSVLRRLANVRKNLIINLVFNLKQRKAFV